MKTFIYSVLALKQPYEKNIKSKNNFFLLKSASQIQFKK